MYCARASVPAGRCCEQSTVGSRYRESASHAEVTGQIVSQVHYCVLATIRIVLHLLKHHHNIIKSII